MKTRGVQRHPAVVHKAHRVSRKDLMTSDWRHWTAMAVDRTVSHKGESVQPRAETTVGLGNGRVVKQHQLKVSCACEDVAEAHRGMWTAFHSMPHRPSNCRRRADPMDRKGAQVVAFPMQPQPIRTFGAHTECIHSDTDQACYWCRACWIDTQYSRGPCRRALKLRRPLQFWLVHSSHTDQRRSHPEDDEKKGHRRMEAGMLDCPGLSPADSSPFRIDLPNLDACRCREACLSGVRQGCPYPNE